MYTITATTIASAHEKVVKLIMNNRDINDVLTEDKEQTFEATEPVNIHIDEPFREPMISESLQFGKKSMESYVEEIFKFHPLTGENDFSYLYSNLIFDYQVAAYNEMTDKMEFKGNGDGFGINQVNYVVNKLAAEPASRRAVISLFNPEIYEKTNDPPCLNHIQFMIRYNFLNMHALFRSNDMLSAWGCNAYALAHLQRYVFDRLKIAHPDLRMGWMETTSISAHIYLKRDQNQLDVFRKRCI
jgi:thymidylate synthase